METKGATQRAKEKFEKDRKFAVGDKFLAKDFGDDDYTSYEVVKLLPPDKKAPHGYAVFTASWFNHAYGKECKVTYPAAPIKEDAVGIETARVTDKNGYLKFNAEATGRYKEGEEYTPSAGRGDYGPSNPWDAPGMSVSDFV